MVRLLVSMLVATLGFITFLGSPLYTAAPVEVGGRPQKDGSNILDNLLDCSVLIQVGDCGGSGVAYRNGKDTFIWTDAHVIEPARKITTVIDPKNGLPVVRVHFDNVWLIQDIQNHHQKVGEQRRLASVIRYSDRHDLAVLKVLSTDWPVGSARFIDSSDTPAPGMAVWHVGSMSGPRGFNSVADGVFACAGRLRNNFQPNELDGVLYDQVSLNSAHPGSSGGGIFRKSDGKCIGLVTEFLGPHRSFGAICLTPARRIREFASQHNCSWAVDGSVAVPASDREHVMRDDIPLSCVR